ncbi:MAG TPA: mechanosensitive ion channel domain-containing protein [Verrucomicrobiales bacterium]|nr:mechanosensitive ion channel domain-containing protein [Verrucomicrobiales bacterium]
MVPPYSPTYAGVRAFLITAGFLGAMLLPFPRQAASQETGSETEPLALPEIPSITPEKVEAEIERLEALPEEQNPDRAQLLELYRSMREDFARASERSESARNHHAARITAPQEAAKLQAEIESGSGVEAPFSIPELSADAPTDQLQMAVRTLRNSLQELRNTLRETEESLRAESARLVDPGAWQAEFDQIREDLQETRDRLAETGPLRENPELSRARRLAQEVHLYQLRSTEAALTQEQLSNAERVELTSLKTELRRRQVRWAEERLDELEASLATKRVSEAELLRQEVAALRELPNASEPDMANVLDACDALAAEALVLAQRLDRLREDQTRVSQELTRVRQIDAEIARIFDQFKRTRSLGPLLLERLRSLPSVQDYRPELEGVTNRLEDARFRQFELENLAEGLRSSEERNRERSTASLESAALSLARATHAKVINRLLAFNREYQNGLGLLEADTRALILNIRSSTGRIRRHILWTRSALPLSWKTLSAAPASLRQFLFAGGERRFPDVILDDLRQHPVSHGAVAAVVVTILLLWRPLIRRLELLSRRVGRVGEDRVLHTIEALGITLVLALPLPLLLVFFANRVLSAPAAGDEVRAVAAGLVQAGTALAWALFVYGLCRRHGVLRGHFRWPDESVRRVRHWLGPLLLVAFPIRFLIHGSNARHAALAGDSPGRIFFILWMIILAAALAVLLHPRRGIFAPWLQSHPGSLVNRLRFLWYPLCILEPLCAAVLAAIGYYYSALELDRVSSQTAWILVLGVLVHAILLRWILVSQRRLAYKLILEKRRSQQKAREEGDAPEEEIEPQPDPADEIDVVEISNQNRTLLRTAVGLGVTFALLAAWSPLFPAFQTLRDIPLWDVARVLDGQKQYVPISLFSLLVSLTALGVTAIAARNLPGFLEISLLQRLKLDPGTRYAIRTISNYVIVAAGLIYSFSLLGIGWSSIQWLVAALSVGLGFGLHEIFANFVSGIILLVERPVRVGDTVTVKNVTGVVTRIRMRATTVTDWDRKELIVPNRNFITSELVNWTLTDPVLRMNFSVGIAYGSDTALAHRVLLDTVCRHPLILEQPPADVFFLEFGESSLRFDIRVFVAEATNLNRTQILHDLHMAIDRACREHGIEIAFPQRDLHLRSIDGVLRVEQVASAANTPHPEPESGKPARRGEEGPVKAQPVRDART